MLKRPDQFMKALFKHLHTTITDTYATWPSEYTYVSGDQEHRFVRQDDERWGQLLHRHDGHVAPLDYGCTASVAVFVKDNHRKPPMLQTSSNITSPAFQYGCVSLYRDFSCLQ
jgi:hypothetical protein